MTEGETLAVDQARAGPGAVTRLGAKPLFVAGTQVAAAMSSGTIRSTDSVQVTQPVPVTPAYVTGESGFSRLGDGCRGRLLSLIPWKWISARPRQARPFRRLRGLSFWFAMLVEGRARELASQPRSLSWEWRWSSCRD